MTPTLYLIRGLPGSGKSTFAIRLLRSKLADCAFEADDYFYKDGIYQFDPKLLSEAHEWCQDSTYNALKKGWSVVVSNTSTTEREVKTYSDIAEDAGASFFSIIVENRHGGKNVHNVPDEHIAKMRNRFTVKL